MRRGVRGADAGKGRADFGVEVRRALAEQVGSPFKTIAAGRDFFRGSSEGVVALAGEEGLLEEAETLACGLGDAHDVPEAGYGMAEGVQAAFGVLCGLRRGGKDHTGGSDGGRD